LRGRSDAEDLIAAHTVFAFGCTMVLVDIMVQSTTDRAGFSDILAVGDQGFQEHKV
jgi:hypothetical protein